MRNSLLASDEPPAVTALRRDGESDFVILVDHAGKLIPRSLDNLGLSDSEIGRHIGWDIGAFAVARLVSEKLDAALVAQTYSRLVIDCNRDPAHPTAMPAISEVTEIPGNQNLSEEDREARRQAIFLPYQTYIADLLDERARQGRKTILIAQHSMTPVYKGNHREMETAVLYNRDARFALPLKEALGATCADNLPYAMTDDSDFTLPVHGEKRGLLHVGLEIRQDLVENEDGQLLWADHIAHALEKARSQF